MIVCYLYGGIENRELTDYLQVYQSDRQICLANSRHQSIRRNERDSFPIAPLLCSLELLHPSQ